MPSFDVVNRVNLQEVDNAVNNTKKEIRTRYDFRQSKTEVNFNKKEALIHILTDDEMKMKAIQSALITHFVRRKLDQKCLNYKEIEGTSLGMIKRDIELQEGIDKDIARKIVKMIKNLKLKRVQAAIQDNQVRVTGKKIDDLQTVIQMLKESDLEIPLQFVNLKD